MEGSRTSTTFERNWVWLLVFLAAIGPATAYFEFGVKPVTTVGWFILMLSLPALVAALILGDRLLGHLGRLDVLGSLDSIRWRFAAAVALVAAAGTIITALVIWWTGPSASARLFKEFLVHNFKVGV